MGRFPVLRKEITGAARAGQGLRLCAQIMGPLNIHDLAGLVRYPSAQGW
ncbi:MAG: hypothetical protein H0W93_01315 [Gammaproteobacteria bacterium]|nr:hypothetical protein [Gammaproteobacteria bacterium]